ncbi:hypothetical protein OFL98_26800, partial [Escherichia coli]|nr:hypothetical protein [Escherichia coli]
NAGKTIPGERVNIVSIYIRARNLVVEFTFVVFTARITHDELCASSINAKHKWIAYSFEVLHA